MYFNCPMSPVSLIFFCSTFPKLLWKISVLQERERERERDRDRDRDRERKGERERERERGRVGVVNNGSN